MFFGTPRFAVPILEALVAAGRTPDLVVTPPARPAGRRHRARQPEAARWALAAGVELVQPQTAVDPGLVARLRRQAPDWAVVAAYGEILRPQLLAIPRHGCLNVHASLLPAYRGASPIQAALAAGEHETGVSIMQMDEGLDTGPVVLARRLAIAPTETAPQLAERLAALGGGALAEALTGIEAGRLEPREQDPGSATWAPRLRREDGRVDWTLAASGLYDRWRAFQPWPGLHASHAGRTLKLLEVSAVPASDRRLAPGVIERVEEGSLVVRCGDGALALGTVQPAGGTPMSGEDFARGARLAAADRLEGPDPR